jgi:hypothetical protein
LTGCPAPLPSVGQGWSASDALAGPDAAPLADAATVEVDAAEQNGAGGGGDATAGADLPGADGGAGPPGDEDAASPANDANEPSTGDAGSGGGGGDPGGGGGDPGGGGGGGDPGGGGGGGGGAACVDVAKPAPVSVDLLPTQTPAGKVETLQANGFTDDYLLQGDGKLKIGVRRQWGASIIFFGFHQGPGGNTTNVIDAHDTGREVQVAFYDPDRVAQGCAWNASCQSKPGTCGNSITYLGWNPVQGGNECNVGSPIESITGSGGVLTAVVRPNHWNPDWQDPGCSNGGCKDPAKKAMLSDVRYTQRLRFVQDNVVEIDMQVDNLTDQGHAATLQEFPTLYASYGASGTPNLKVLLDSNGQAITIDQPANDGFFVKEFSSPGGWATLQNAKQDYGVALYYENRTSGFQGWQKSGVFNNFRSKFSFGLGPKASVRARAYLVLGGYGTVKGLIGALDAKLPPFGALDTPTPEAQATGQVQLAGWTLDNAGVTQVEAWLDGQPWGKLPLNVPRPDVCAAWPGYAMCAGAVGFAHSLPLPAGLGVCGHLLEIVATDSHGNARVVARQRLFTNGGTQPPDPDPPPNPDPDPPPDPPPEPDPPPPAIHPVWRALLQKPGATDHMFTLQPQAKAGYVLEGQAFSLFDGPGDAKHPMVPLVQRYCAACTDHMPSLDPNEGSPEYTGAEPLGWCSPSQQPWAPKALVRVYSVAKTDHFLVADAAELQAVLAMGYVKEWTCWGP